MACLTADACHWHYTMMWSRNSSMLCALLFSMCRDSNRWLFWLQISLKFSRNDSATRCASSLTFPHSFFTLCEQHMEHVESKSETERICEVEWSLCCAGKLRAVRNECLQLNCVQECSGSVSTRRTSGVMKQPEKEKQNACEDWEKDKKVMGRRDAQREEK